MYNFLRHKIDVQIFKDLLKSGLLITSLVVVVLAICVLNEWIDIDKAAFAAVAVFFMSIIVVRPYLADLRALTIYVDSLTNEVSNPKPPDLSFLSNIIELSTSVKQLNSTWKKRKLQLESIIVENKIIFDTLPDLILMLDNGTRIIRTNNIANTIFGHHIYRKPISYIIDNKALRDAINDIKQSDISHKRLEIYLDSPIDRHYLISIERFPVVSENFGVELIIVMHDITDSKQTERMLADFVANASHEIRTPLTSIIGFIEILQTVGKDDPDAIEKFLGIMATKAEHMSTLVTELLTLSTLEGKVNALLENKMDISHLVDDVYNKMKWDAHQKNINIKLNIDDDIPEVVGDYGELRQVCVNLLNNAIKYSTEDTIIEIKAGISDNTPFNSMQRAIFFQINDQGEGIAPEHIERLTERFYRIDRARSRSVGGSGLGLAIVKSILQRHHARIHIASKVGKGSKFTVYLPFPNDFINE